MNLAPVPLSLVVNFVQNCIYPVSIVAAVMVFVCSQIFEKTAYIRWLKTYQILENEKKEIRLKGKANVHMPMYSKHPFHSKDTLLQKVQFVGRTTIRVILLLK